MCYPAPGPRCSRHAYNEYIEAKQKYTLSTDSNQKLSLGIKLKEKETAYYATKRGQSFLRREADATTGIERDKLLILKEAGERLREQQLKAYYDSIDRSSSSLRDKAGAKDIKLGRYDSAVGIASLFLADKYKDLEFHIESKDTVIVNNNKIFVLPRKYQSVFAEALMSDDEKFATDDEKLSFILNSTSSYEKMPESLAGKTSSWFIGQLREKGYKAVAIVNNKTEDVAIIDIDEISNLFDINLKVAKKLGGTTFYNGDIEHVKELVKGTIFESGKVLSLPDRKKVVIYDIPPQAKKEGFLSDDIFLGWHASSDENIKGYFEVRKRHQSKKYNIIVKLLINKELFSSAIDEKVKHLFQ
jgi:hypothetical protein